MNDKMNDFTFSQDDEEYIKVLKDEYKKVYIDQNINISQKNERLAYISIKLQWLMKNDKLFFKFCSNVHKQHRNKKCIK